MHAKHKNGITLVALVVTIIILIILATISIRMVIGEGGLINQANRAKIEYRAAEVDEEVLAWKAEQEMAKYDKGIEVQSRDDLIADQLKRGLLTEEEANTATETGEVKIGSTTIHYGENETPEEDPNLPKTANQLKAGDNVLLPYNDGTIECVVLYDSQYNTENNKEYGIQIISKDIVEDNYTYKRTEPWDDYIHALNARLEKYIDGSNRAYVSSVRCVGSLPDNPENKELIPIDPDPDEEGRSPYYDDLNSEPDLAQMEKYHIDNIGKEYFLASRLFGGETSWRYQCIGYLCKVYTSEGYVDGVVRRPLGG